VLLAPRSGQLLASRRPLLQGLAQSGTEVTVLINGRVVARVTADGQGRWAYKMVDPLPVGESMLVVSGQGATVANSATAEPVVVTVAQRELDHVSEVRAAPKWNCRDSLASKWATISPCVSTYQTLRYSYP
jgi:hypothetical protein